ncbi:MAG: hypothetical protein DWQ01_21930 [Planctomycetota bacterium]|nr:MAG: hypothetical protein DWQ01_21930 [Planctomycetota bacterium]
MQRTGLLLAATGLAVLTSWSGKLSAQTVVLNPTTPFQIEFDAGAWSTGDTFSAVHGVSGVPVANPMKYDQSAPFDWGTFNQNDPNTQFLRVPRADHAIRYAELLIPQVRTHNEGVGDVNRIWYDSLYTGANNELYGARDLDLSSHQSELNSGYTANQNPAYDFTGLDQLLQGLDEVTNNPPSAPSGHLPQLIYRAGVGKMNQPDEGVVHTYSEAPNDFWGFARFVRKVLLHINANFMGGTGLQTKADYVEIWNEPYIQASFCSDYETARKGFFNLPEGDLNIPAGYTLCDLVTVDPDAMVSGGGNKEDTLPWQHGVAYAELYEAVMFNLDLESLLPDLVGIASLNAPSELVAGEHTTYFTEGFLSHLSHKYSVQGDPARYRVEAVTMHPYLPVPHKMLYQMENLDTALATFQPNLAYGAGFPPEDPFYPEVWFTEWNRSIDHYTRGIRAMPYLINAFYYMDGLYHQDFLRSDGQAFQIQFAGANFFSGNKLWYSEADGHPSAALEARKKHPGLVWEVYGKTLYQEHPYRLPPLQMPSVVEGTPFGQWEDILEAGNVPDPWIDVKAMAGYQPGDPQDPDDDQIVVVVSNLYLNEFSGIYPQGEIHGNTYRVQHQLKLQNMPFVPATMERKADVGGGGAGYDNHLTDLSTLPNSYQVIPLFYSTPHQVGGTLQISVPDMVQNSYEVYVIKP